MSTFSWRNARLSREVIPVPVGNARLSLHRFYRNPEGTPVFMVASLGEDHTVFAPNEADSGLAHFLADIGYDVYVAEVRNHLVQPSLSQSKNKPDWGLHNLIMEDIPTQLSAVMKIRPREPQFWVGHGVGSLLLTACYSRLDLMPAPVLGFVQFAASRRCELSSMAKTLAYMGWQSCMQISAKANTRIGWIPVSGESEQVVSELCQWHQDIHWIDPIDGFNYRLAIADKGLPSSLYFSLDDTLWGEKLWGSINDTRLWVQELGSHDAQMFSLSRANGNLRNYSYTSILTHPDACDDHFIQLQQWLESRKNSESWSDIKTA
jgi:hypothetical protein